MNHLLPRVYAYNVFQQALVLQNIDTISLSFSQYFKRIRINMAVKISEIFNSFQDFLTDEEKLREVSTDNLLPCNFSHDK